MAELAKVVAFLDAELRSSEVPDYESALNGLQLANDGRVARVAAAVDFSSATVDAAVNAKADLLLVHHGMLWGGPHRLVGPRYAQLRAAIGGNLAVYSSHLPLDLHPVHGNNALFARELGLTADGTFGRFRDVEIGVQGASTEKTSTLAERVAAFAAKYRTTAVHTPFAPNAVTRRWAIVTGAGADADTIAEAVERGVDTLIVGEGPHHSAVLAMDAGVVVLYGGHYATETFGVRVLAELVAKRFDVPQSFLDFPTGL